MARAAHASAMLVGILGFSLQVADACCRGSKPDPTFIDSDEFYLTSISPNRGMIGGGSRVTLKGGGFNTNFFTGGNYVYIGSDSTEWVTCTVIEGACSVECGGPKTIVCDTGEWTYGGSALAASGWLDVKVLIETFGDAGTSEAVEVTLSNAYYYFGHGHSTYVPMLQSVYPHAASSEETITLRGVNFGYWVQDYRLIYVGTGRAPQGGNVNNGAVGTSQLTTHALCRPDDLNTVSNPNEPDLASASSAPVMPEDREADPIAEDVISCALGDFSAGSYNVSLYHRNDKRTGGSLNSDNFIPGLAVVYDSSGFIEPGLFSRDARGVLHMVQYYPRIDSISPTAGSIAGGTVVTIEGGGFSMDEMDQTVSINNRDCVVTYSSIEMIICNTTAVANVTTPSKVSSAVHSLDSADEEEYTWMSPVQVAGVWSAAASPFAYTGSTLTWTYNASDGTAAWVTFAPDSDYVSGTYEASLLVPVASECLAAAKNVSVVVRSSEGYSLRSVSLLSGRDADGGEGDDGDPLETDKADSSFYVSLGDLTLIANASMLVSSLLNDH